ncbi:MAG: hypothetical protein GC179_22990 [Anaerolineaceae bacterium]|nr:hypothetical protein [Anaerolineaceae bacterium]
MRKYLWAILISLCFSASINRTAAQNQPREQIKSIKSYIVYYGKGRLDDLAKFDLAIIQPDTLSKDELKQLHEKGTLVVSYLSVGEAEPGREWFTDGRVDQKWLLGKNENWGSYFVDASQKGWQDLMVSLTGEFIKKGFDGVFLDTVDTVDQFPQTKQGMIDLIDKLRTAYPDALLVQNRGFSVIEQVQPEIDALMFEDLITSYNFTNKEYIYADNSYTAEQMAALSKRTGLPILALDYAPLDNSAMAYKSIEAAKKYGFIPAVSVINLDDIPDYGLNAEPAEDIRVKSLTVESDGTNNTIVTQIENIGLKSAPNIGLSLTVGGEQIATAKYENVDIGEIKEWRVAWQSASETATIKVTAFSVNDRKAGNNNKTLAYKATSVAVEPLLPPDQQKRRPAENGPDLVATALTKPLTIDGDLTDWADFPCTNVNSKDQLSFGDASLWSGADDLSGRVCYAWDSENIYVAMDITDDVIVQKYEGTNTWHGDHVELWFDTQLQLDFDSATASDDDFQLGLSPGNFKDVKPSIFIWQPAVLDDVYANIEYAVKQTDKGYSAELKIPATVLKGLRLATDNAIGATFDPSDTDEPTGTDQENMLSTAPHTQWGVPTLWNNLILKDTPGAG